MRELHKSFGFFVSVDYEAKDVKMLCKPVPPDGIRRVRKQEALAGMEHAECKKNATGKWLENAWTPESLYRTEGAPEKRFCHMQLKKISTGRISKIACMSTAPTKAKKENKQRKDGETQQKKPT